MNKEVTLSEQDVRSKYISPAIARAGWDPASFLVREEFPITAGRIIADYQAKRTALNAKIDGLLAQLEEKLK